SHELRTPLNTIMGWANLLAGGKLDDATTRRAAETIGRNAATQAKLIEDLLDVSRIITGKVRLDLSQVDLAEAVLTAVESVHLTADAKRVRLETEIPEPGEPVAADPERLQQILWNLLTNAVKFTPPDGGVRVSARFVAGEAEIEVADSGEGIAPE